MSNSLYWQGMHRPKMAPGIVLTLALHALLIVAWLLDTPAPAAAPNKTMLVWLQAPQKPKVQLQPTPPPAMAAPTANARPALARAPEAAKARASAQPPSVATPATTVPAPAPADAAAVAATPAPYDPLREAAPAPGFDMEAARKAARKIASEKDPARADTLAGRLEAHPLYPEDKETALQKGIASAKRGDCLKQGGNLLTPLFWLLDKKDHGCKF
ncbi:MAG: hypothetical protein ABW202_15065 [Duganella sp.]